MSELYDLLEKYSADERFVTHRELHRIARMARDEMELLRDELESVRAGWDGEIVISAQWKRERDEAREAARWLYLNMDQAHECDMAGEAERRWPWLEEE